MAASARQGDSAFAKVGKREVGTHGKSAAAPKGRGGLVPFANKTRVLKRGGEAL
jgi:hypothetical protein